LSASAPRYFSVASRAPQRRRDTGDSGAATEGHNHTAGPARRDDLIELCVIPPFWSPRSPDRGRESSHRVEERRNDHRDCSGSWEHRQLRISGESRAPRRLCRYLGAWRTVWSPQTIPCRVAPCPGNSMLTAERVGAGVRLGNDALVHRPGLSFDPSALLTKPDQQLIRLCSSSPHVEVRGSGMGGSSPRPPTAQRAYRARAGGSSRCCSL